MKLQNKKTQQLDIMCKNQCELKINLVLDITSKNQCELKINLVLDKHSHDVSSLLSYNYLGAQGEQLKGLVTLVKTALQKEMIKQSCYFKIAQRCKYLAHTWSAKQKDPYH